MHHRFFFHPGGLGPSPAASPVLAPETSPEGTPGHSSLLGDAHIFLIAFKKQPMWHTATHGRMEVTWSNHLWLWLLIMYIVVYSCIYIRLYRYQCNLIDQLDEYTLCISGEKPWNIHIFNGSMTGIELKRHFSHSQMKLPESRCFWSKKTRNMHKLNNVIVVRWDLEATTGAPVEIKNHQFVCSNYGLAPWGQAPAVNKKDEKELPSGLRNTGINL